MIKIRLARGGRANLPIFTIVAAEERSCRDGKFLEKLGQYNPNNPETLKAIKVEAISKWLAKGAQITDTVKTLLKKNNIKVK